MRKSFLLLVPIVLMAVTGCDFMRTVAGRPTEEELVKKRIEILKAEEAAVQARIDSLKAAEEKSVRDSLATAAAVKPYKVMYGGPEKLRGIAGRGLDYKYYIIVGVFRESRNARDIFNAASAKGYSPVLINSRSGMMAVALAPTNSRERIEQTYQKVRKETFCPSDAWVLINE